MSTHRILFRIACGLFAVLIIAGCASPSPRARFLQELQPAGVTNLSAYRTGANIEIRIPLPGRDAFAHANWPRVEAGAPGYQHRFAVLTFDKEQRAVRKTAVTRTNAIPIRNVAQWRNLLLKVFTGFVPATPTHGVLLLVQNQEVVIFRDAAGKAGVAKLDNQPPGITLDHTFNDTDFSREAIRALESGVDAIEARQKQFLFLTGEDPAFAYIDLQQRLVVFLSYPGDPETQELPGIFVMRAARSLLFKSMLVTAIKNPFTLISRGLWHLGTSGSAALTSAPGSPTNAPPPLATGPGMDLAAWEKELDGLVSDKRYKGRVDLYIDGEKFYPALIQSLESAARSIDILVFIFDTDDYAVKIADLLKKRSSSVSVRVLMDDAGSLFAGQAAPQSPVPVDFKRPNDIQAYLRDGSRVAVRASANPWLTVDHRKCFIIDGRQAYLGGMNIGREYRYEWHDMMVGLTGPVVGRLEKGFRKAWAHAGPLGDFAYAWASVFDRTASRRNEITNAIDVRPLRTATFRPEIYTAQLAAIQRARRCIYIENAYFDDGMILRALILARRRGVDVRVIFPAENDSGIMQTSDEMIGNELIENGIRVYVYPGMTHVKAAVYDGWACLGSANFNKMSLHVGQELDIGFSDPPTVDRLKRELFETDFARSRELTKPVPLNWFDPFVKAFADEL